MNIILKAILCYLFLLPSTSQTISFAVLSSIAAPNTAKSFNSAYTIQLSTTLSFSTAFSLNIAFPSAFPLTSVINCQLRLNGVNVLSTCNIISNVISFTNLNITVAVEKVGVSFTTATARFAKLHFLTLTYYNPNNTSQIYGSNTAGIRIVSAQMNCSLTSTTTVVGAPTTYSLSYTPTVTVQPTSQLQVQLPPWSGYNLSNFLSTNTSSICNSQCTLAVPNPTLGLTSQLLTYTSLPTTTTLQFASARNPSSTKPITLTLTVLAYVSASDQSPYLFCTATYSPTLPNAFKNIVLNTQSNNPANTSISAINTFNLVLSLNNPLSSACLLRITSDLPLSFTYSTSNQLSTQQLYPSSANTLLIGNLTTSSTFFTLFFLGNFIITNPPYANFPASITLQTQLSADGTTYLIDQGTISISSTPSTIVSASLSSTNYFISTLSTLTISFLAVNTLLPNSLIHLEFPPEMSTFGITPTLNTSPCLITNASHISCTLSTTQPNFTFILSNVMNPLTTTPTSSFKITTFYANTSTPVDILTNLLTYTAQPVSLISFIATPLSLIVGAFTTYTFTFTPSHPLPPNTSFTLTLPPVFPTSSPLLQSITPTSASCTLLIASPLTYNFTNCIPTTTSTTLSLTLSSIFNPTSTKPTSLILLQLFFNGYLLQYANTTITLVTPATIPIFTITPQNPSVTFSTTYTFDLTLAFPPSAQLLITFPPELTLLPAFTCSLNCLQTTSSTLQLTLQTNSSTVSFTITNIRNNFFVNTVAITILTTTNDTALYYIERGTASLTFQPTTLQVTTSNNNKIILLSTSIITLNISTNLIYPNPSNATLLITLPNELSALTCTAPCTATPTTLTLSNILNLSTPLSITFSATTPFLTTSSPFTIVLSQGTYPIASSTTATISSYCTPPCQQCGTSPTLCLSCLPSPHTPNNTLFNSTCVQICPPAFFKNNSQCSPCLTPCTTCSTTPTLCLTCTPTLLLLNSTCLPLCPPLLYSNTTHCLPCTSPCGNCTTPTLCLSCTPPFTLNPDSTCTPVCNNPLQLPINNVCTSCTNNCRSCSITLANCTSCTNTFLLFNGTCTRTCLDGYFNNSQSNCQLCIHPCVFCNDALLCTSCTPFHYLYNSTTCTEQCPDGTLPIIATCIPCVTPCATCSNTPSQCRTCTPPHLLLNSTCYTICPPPTYPYAGTCTNCLPPCLTCSTNALTCASCTPPLLLLNSTCLTSCPTLGYLASDSACLPCPQNCLSCPSPNNCTLCSSDYLLWLGTCLTNCPANYPIVISQQCIACAPQCNACQNTSQSCTVCSLNYFKFSFTCVQSCPLSYFSDLNTYTCQSGLLRKIVFFPILITTLLITFIVVIVKCCSPPTSIPTLLTALTALLQMISWAYLLSLLNGDALEASINYLLPTALLAMALTATAFLNVVFRATESSARDEYVQQWANNNVNYTTYRVCIWSTLLSHKLFRLVYSKAFDSLHLSMAPRQPAVVLRPSTIFTLLTLLLCEVPAVSAAFYLLYDKLLKDQLFYTALETLAVSVLALGFALLDIHKAQNYFEETEFMRMKRFVEKVKDSSAMKLEEEESFRQEPGLENYTHGRHSPRGLSNSRLYKQQSNDQLMFEEPSQATLVVRDEQKSEQIPYRTKKNKIINVFEPIQEEEAEYYEQEKYGQTEVQTEAENQRLMQREHSQDKLKIIKEDVKESDDNRSMMEYRERKRQWNKILSKRQQIARKIFSHFEGEEKIEELQDGSERERMPKRIRRRKKKGKHNKELEKIYLDRLTSKKNVFASSRSFNYDF